MEVFNKQMPTNNVVFLSTELPTDWEKVVDRERIIREQHRCDIEHTYRRAFETGTISKYQPVRTLMSTLLPAILKRLEAMFDPPASDTKARHNKAFLKRMQSEPYDTYAYIA